MLEEISFPSVSLKLISFSNSSFPIFIILLSMFVVAKRLVILDKLSLFDLSSVISIFIFRPLKNFLAISQEFITDLIVLSVYSIFGASKILFLF